MAIYPTIKSGGGNLEMAVESALGTAGTYYDFRQCEDSDPAFPTDTREVLAVSSKGYWDPAVREPQLSYEKAMENAGTVATYVASSTGTPQCVTLFEAMGCGITTGSATPDAATTYSSTTAWAASAASSALVTGTAGLYEDTSHNYWPFLVCTNSGAAAYNITPTMAIPVASENSADLLRMTTIIPPKGSQVSTSKTLAFRVSSYFATSTETGSCHTYTGCAPAEIKPIVIESGKPLKMECGIHIAKRAFDQSGIDLTLPTYTDSVAIPFVDGSGNGLLFGLADAGSSPIAAARTVGFRKATWNPGIKTVPVLESGATTAVNGWGAYLGQYTGSTLEIVADVNKDYWTRLESSGSQTARYVEIVHKAATVASSSWGLWMPQCYMVGKPVMDLWGDKEMTVTFTLEPRSAGYVSTAKTSQGNAPWYFAVGII